MVPFSIVPYISLPNEEKGPPGGRVDLGLAGERKAPLKNYADLASTSQETQGMPRISNNSNNSNSNSNINGYSNNSNSSSN